MKYGREKHQLDLEVGTLNSVKLTRKPDVIIYSNVLEHLTDPVAELKTIKNILHPEGLLFIEVPGIKNIHLNYRSDFLLYLQNAHTYHFSLTALKNIFLKTGFDMIYGDEYVRAIAKQGDILSDKWDSDYEKVKDYLLQTESKRKFYSFTVRGLKEDCVAAGLKIADAIGIRGVLRKFRKLFSK